MKRRHFLRNTALASSAAMVPAFLRGNHFRSLERSRAGKILVVVQLSGGNDGLNTIIPWHNELYYKFRPQLGITANKVLKLNDEMGLNPALAPLQKIYDAGEMTIVNNVGYPNPIRSHFRSMDIWHSASNSNEYLTSGWLGRYLDSDCPNCQNPHFALELDGALSLAMKGKQRNGFGLNNVKTLKRTANNPILKQVAQRNQSHEETVAYLYKTLIDTQTSANFLHAKSRVHKSKITYPRTEFGKDLKQTAELITADSDTQIYYLSLGGFDTHVGQLGRQARLHKQYAEGMAAFVKDLKENNLLDDTLIMTFSEFGRRVKQNASNGTDHGTANNVLLMGGGLKQKGFYNEAPDLVNLDNGDLIHRVDFRNIYADILGNWLDAPVQEVLGQGFSGLGLV